MRRLVALLVGIACALAALPAAAQGPGAPPPGPVVSEPEDPVRVEAIRARVLARLGRVEEALASMESLVAARPTDRSLKEEYVEVLMNAGRLGQAGRVIDGLLAGDPKSVRLHRFRARVDLDANEPLPAAHRLHALLDDAPHDTGVAAELATAQLALGHWASAVALYSGILQREPDNEDVRTAYRSLLLNHANRVDLRHRTILQQAATHHTEEATWRVWLGERTLLTSLLRLGHYTQDTVLTVEGFDDHTQTLGVLVEHELARRLRVRAGLEESRHEHGEVFRTTGRLGAVYDDARATFALLDVAIRELLTNPVVAVRLDGCSDRATLDVTRRLAPWLSVTGHYDVRHHTVKDETLGTQWELLARADVEGRHGPAWAVLSPQLFFAEFVPAHSRFRDTIAFLRRQDIVALGLRIGAEVLPGLRLEAAIVGRRDLHRAVTSYELLGDVRWKIHPRAELAVVYTRNTESTATGGKEESFTGTVSILY